MTKNLTLLLFIALAWGKVFTQITAKEISNEVIAEKKHP